MTQSELQKAAIKHAHRKQFQTQTEEAFEAGARWHFKKFEEEFDKAFKTGRLPFIVCDILKALHAMLDNDAVTGKPLHPFIFPKTDK